MGFSCGIVGLANVGKSTLFNALTKQNAKSSNYPFCTIEPNIGIVPINDKKLNEIFKYSNSKKIVPAFMHFTDIAGLVKNASKGQGLGNKFLANIRETEAIIHVLRLFEDKEISHTENNINPIDDFETVMTELKIKDIELIENKKNKLTKNIKVGIKNLEKELAFINKLEDLINKNKNLAKINNLSEKETVWLNEYKLLSAKPQIIVANLSEEQIANLEKLDKYKELIKYIEKEDIEVIPISSKLESELAKLSEEEMNEYIESFGIKELSLNNLIKKGHELLKLITFYTMNVNECRAWSIKKNTKAIKAAGKIHTDFEKGFIKAEVIKYGDFINAKGAINTIKENGKLQIEGKDYIIQDEDIVQFRFNL